jgi:hypothetical protein
MPLFPGAENISHLYKYRSTDSQFTFDDLEKGQLYFSCPLEFNDPFDSKPNMIMEGTKDEFIAWVNKYPYIKDKKRTLEYCKNVDYDGKKIIKYLNLGHIDEARILCFSENNDSTLMWSHYSNSHKGFCLGFKTEIKGNNLNMLFNESDVTYRHSDITPGMLPLKKVQYNKDMPPNYNILKSSTDELIVFFNSKHSDWSYEREHRILIPINLIKQQKVRFEKSILDEVIFGCNTSEDVITKTKNILKEKYPNNGKDIYLKKAVLVNGNFKLKIEDI